MIFCEKCFHDKEISSRIHSFNKIGHCPTCHRNDVHIYNTDEQHDLTPTFEELLNIYSSVDLDNKDKLCGNISTSSSLAEDIQNRWGIFNKLSLGIINDILKSICKDLYDNSPELFCGNVVIPELKDNEFLEHHSLVRNLSWDNFVDELKYANRYHSKILNFSLLNKYCSYIRKVYKKGDIFFRARISPKEGYPIDKMSAPPHGKSAEGRANASGITCLYLAKDPDTTLHEVRAGMHDYVSVGRFQLLRDITVVDLCSINDISPFTYNLDFLDHAINAPYLVKLNSEMSKPLRRNDSTLDYVPTQYIVDYIKSIENNGNHEYDGIEYNSTTKPGGVNLAIFYPDLLKCIDVQVYDIKKLEYSTDPSLEADELQS